MRKKFPCDFHLVSYQLTSFVHGLTVLFKFLGMMLCRLLLLWMWNLSCLSLLCLIRKSKVRAVAVAGRERKHLLFKFKKSQYTPKTYTYYPPSVLFNIYRYRALDYHYLLTVGPVVPLKQWHSCRRLLAPSSWRRDKIQDCEQYACLTHYERERAERAWTWGFIWYWPVSIWGLFDSISKSLFEYILPELKLF